MSENMNIYRRQIQQNEENDISIDLLALCKELLVHWYLILILAVLLGGGAYSYCKFFVTPLYRSTSELLVLSKTTDNTSYSDLQIGTNLTKDYMIVVVGRPVLDQVAENLGLSMSYASLKGKVSVSNVSDRIIAITVTDADAERAKLIADEIAEVSSAFIADELDQDKPSIIQRGYTDGKSVYPRTKRTTAVGAAAGILLACFWIILHYLMNDTIMTSEDVENKIGLYVLGALPYDEVEQETDSKRRKRVKKSKK